MRPLDPKSLKRHEGEGGWGRNRGPLTKVSQGDVAQDIEAPLLELVGQPQQRQGAPGVPHQEQQLGPPKLHMVLPDIQPEQVFTHLGPGVRCGEEGLKRAVPTHHLSDKNPDSSHSRRKPTWSGVGIPDCLPLPVPLLRGPQPGGKARPG